MADCNRLLKKYDEENRLAEEKREILKAKRDELAEIVKDYFIEKGYRCPDFKGQGSFKMKTIINPKNEEEAYDIDHGVYINKKDIENNDETLKTSFTIQSWVKSAVEAYVEENPQTANIEKIMHKNKCIRVIYKKSDEGSFHVDLPVYYKEEDKCYLAVKEKASEDSCGWEESDPSAIVEWFQYEIKEENKGEQYRRIVRYFKNWSALQNWNTQKPTGLLLTVLASNGFSESAEDDEVAIVETASNIKTILEQTDPFLANPIQESENLLEKYSDTAINAIVEKLGLLVESGSEAINSDEEEAYESEKIWVEIFSDLKIDFSEDDSSENKALVTSAPAILGNANRSA